MMKPGEQSFWELPIGGMFIIPNDSMTKAPKAYVRVSECEFSRPGGKRRWMMFRPDGVCVFPQMIIPVPHDSAINHSANLSEVSS